MHNPSTYNIPVTIPMFPFLTLHYLMIRCLVLRYLMLHYVNVALLMLHLLVFLCLLSSYWLFRHLMFHHVNGALLYIALLNVKFLTSHLACFSSNLKQLGKTSVYIWSLNIFVLLVSLLWQNEKLNISFDKICWLTPITSSPKIWGRGVKVQQS